MASQQGLTFIYQLQLLQTFFVMIDITRLQVQVAVQLQAIAIRSQLISHIHPQTRQNAKALFNAFDRIDIPPLNSLCYTAFSLAVIIQSTILISNLISC